MQLVLVGIAAAAAGLLNGVTGFGANIVMVAVLSQTFSVVESAGIGQSICLAVTFGMAWHYRAHVNFRAVWGPVVGFMAVSWSCILVAEGLDQTLMKLVLGIFLMLLSAYFLFIQREQESTGAVPLPVTVACVAVSGACDGLFGIGGPLMVVYYLMRCQSKEEYLGTVQAFFSIVTLLGVSFRIVRGILVASHVPYIALGAACVLLGLAVANRVVAHLDTATVRKLTYGVIGVAGLYNAGSALMLMM